VRKLGECDLLTLASPIYLSKHGEPKHPYDLRNHECLIYANDSAVSTWTYRENGEHIAVQVRGRIVANNGAALMEAAVRGMGIVCQPDFIAANYMGGETLRQVLKNFEIAPLGIYAILPSNRYIPHRVNLLIAYLEKQIRSPHA
jgi:DNA-binding transcriptional LysR family regulator